MIFFFFFFLNWFSAKKLLLHTDLAIKIGNASQMGLHDLDYPDSFGSETMSLGE
jgi:hypothetical protein